MKKNKQIKKDVYWLGEKTEYSPRYLRTIAHKIPGAKNPTGRCWIFTEESVEYIKRHKHWIKK